MIEEKLLNAWLNMSLCIKGNRVLNNISFNEMSIFNALIDAEKNHISLSFKELCDHTKMLKSQLNRVLKNMLEKKYIKSMTSKSDKRSVLYYINDYGKEIYEKEHSKVLMIIDLVINNMGENNVLQLTNLMCDATNIVNKYMEKNNEYNI